MIHAPLALLLFWALAAVGVTGVVVAVLAGRLRPSVLLTQNEWRAALQFIGIIALTLAIIYYQNGHFSDRATFIYGRF